MGQSGMGSQWARTGACGTHKLQLAFDQVNHEHTAEPPEATANVKGDASRCHAALP